MMLMRSKTTLQKGGDPQTPKKKLQGRRVGTSKAKLLRGKEVWRPILVTGRAKTLTGVCGERAQPPFRGRRAKRS